MNTEQLAQTGALITIAFTGLVALFSQLSKSRCTEIDCFCIKCKRTIIEQP